MYNLLDYKKKKKNKEVSE